MDKETKRIIWKGVLIVFGCALGTFFFFVTYAFWLADPIREGLLASRDQVLLKVGAPLVKEEADYLAQLVRSGAVLTQDQLLERITSFYEALLQILVTLLGFVAGASYLYVRAVSLDHAESTARSEAQKAVDSKFRETEFTRSVELELSKIVKPYQRRFDEVDAALSGFSDAQDSLSKLNELDIGRRLELLEMAVSQLDLAEEKIPMAQIDVQANPS